MHKVTCHHDTCFVLHCIPSFVLQCTGMGAMSSFLMRQPEHARAYKYCPAFQLKCAGLTRLCMQPLGSRCKACDKKLARSTANASGTDTHHWEGGKGCRDKKRLDRRDAQKYRGSRAKTVSKKSSRVGQAAGRKRTAAP